MIDQIKTFVETDLLSGGSIATDDELLLSGLVDSLGVMRLVGFIETTFGVQVPARDMKLKNFRTIAAIVGYLEAKADA
jgi:acyl carrier protein